MDDSLYTILQRLPTPQEYHDLRKLANLTPPPMQDIPKALANSTACFLAFERAHMADETTPATDQHPVAMGRAHGDGALFLMVTDVAVHPDHQGQGIGKRILKALVDYVDTNAPNAYVSLVADPLGQKLYPQFGFEDVKPSIGMFRCARIQNDPAFRKAREARGAALLRSE